MRSPIVTMTAITGKPSKERAFEYMQSLKENGITEVLLYPRSGCEIEYLSQGWFDTVGFFIDAAARLDMYIWLYDDFNWPSADAGGRVTAVPEYRLRAICTKGQDAGKISTKSLHNSGLFGEKFFPNLLSHQAVDYFISCTHEEYRCRFGQFFSTVIKGIFTDEPSIGYCCDESSIPYYEEIEQDYQREYQRDFYGDMRAEDEGFYSRAVLLVSKRFKLCYLDKIGTWCKSHGILMTGHFMCDHNIIEGVKHSGHVLENLSTLSLPGIDEIYSAFDDVCEAALFATAEYASGENGAMAELFALGPCDISYAKRRAMLYLAACHKINRYFVAISHLDMRGNRLVKDFFNTCSSDQPDFLGMKELSKEAINAANIAKKDFTPDVYVRFPFEFAAQNVARRVDTTPFFQMLNSLTYNQIQWKFTDSASVSPLIEVTKDFEFTLDKQPLDITKIKHEITVTDKNSATPEGIFVRRFKDLSLVAINLFADDGEYLINNKPVFLKKYDVYLSENEKIATQGEEFSPIFRVKYNNPNVIRTMHLSQGNQAEIACLQDTPLTFAVREDCTAFANGEEIAARNPANLCNGLKDLYKSSGETVLKKGVHTALVNNDLKYLPSLLLVGDFEAKAESGQVCRLTLSPRRSTYSVGERIYGYGSVELLASIAVPKGAKSLEISGTELVTEAFVDGEPLGVRAFSPYAFSIPSHLWGKEVSLKIVQYSSIAPMFGDVDFWDKNVKECGWRHTPSTENKPFGFSKICFNF